MRLKTVIVGMRYRSNVSERDLAKVATQKVILVREPSNAHDANAIKCLVDGKHIGYITREDAAILAPNLDSRAPYSVQFLERHKNSIAVSVEVDTPRTERRNLEAAKPIATSQKPASSQTQNDSQDKEAEGCFIASHCYGFDDPRTNYLRDMRDQYLKKTPLGRAFVAVYYRLSPRLVLLCRRNQILNIAVVLSMAVLLRLAGYRWKHN